MKYPLERGRQNATVTTGITALSIWWDEIQSGSRSVHDRDALWQAACLEARARDAARLGQTHAAGEDRCRAARVLLEAFVQAAP